MVRDRRMASSRAAIAWGMRSSDGVTGICVAGTAVSAREHPSRESPPRQLLRRARLRARLRVLVEKVKPRWTEIGRGKKNCTFCRSAARANPVRCRSRYRPGSLRCRRRGCRATSLRRPGGLEISPGSTIPSVVSPSLQVNGNVYFSVCTSTPSARKAATAHLIALAISGEPVTRPPLHRSNAGRFPSKRRRSHYLRQNFDAASAHDASVAEHATGPWPAAGLANGSVLAAGNCREKPDGAKHARTRAANKSKPHVNPSGKIPTVTSKIGARKYSASRSTLFQRPSDSLAVIRRKAERKLTRGAMMLVSTLGRRMMKNKLLSPVCIAGSSACAH